MQASIEKSEQYRPAKLEMSGGKYSSNTNENETIFEMQDRTRNQTQTKVSKSHYIWQTEFSNEFKCYKYAKKQFTEYLIELLRYNSIEMSNPVLFRNHTNNTFILNIFFQIKVTENHIKGGYIYMCFVWDSCKHLSFFVVFRGVCVLFVCKKKGCVV